MAYFRIDSGGNGGSGGVTLIVNYSEDFIGQTITATNGTTTLTKTATSSGSVEFAIEEGGTWVISGTVGGDTYSVEQYVEMEFEKTLEALPNGSTATPTNDIQTWLKCAQIKDKAYTTLSQVLSDAATLEALLSDSNACDYMARSTNWASGVAADANAMKLIGKFDYCANKLLSNSTWLTAIANSTYFESVLNVKVPKMTSNTAPEGEAFASSYTQAGYEAWHAFNQSTQSPWFSGTGTFQYVGYKFTKPVIVNKVYLDTYLPGYIGSMKIQGSNDNTNWVDLCDFFTVDSYPYNKVLNNSTAYTYYRLYATVGSAANAVVMDIIQFYGREETTYIPLVPVMTSNTTPSGEASSNDAYTGYEAYKAFDRNDSGNGWAPATTTLNRYVQYKFTSPIRVSKIGLYFKDSTGHTNTIELSGSNDDINFTPIKSDISLASGAWYYFSIPNDTTYTTYRITFLTEDITGNHRGLKAQFYASSDPATQVLLRSAAQDDLYYLDNGSPVIIAHTNDYGYAVIDRDLLPEGESLTLYSTVAKNPISIGSPYSRVIHFSKYLTDVYLMYINSLYWYGFGADDWSVFRDTYGAKVEYNTNNILYRGYIQQNINQSILHTKNMISLLGLTDAHMLISYASASPTISALKFGYTDTLSLAAVLPANCVDITPSTSIQKVTASLSGATTDYIAYEHITNTTATITAIWLE